MKKNAIILSLALSLLLAASGCKKYEQGPALSFRSKTQRIANTWKLGKVLEAGTDKTVDYKNLFQDWQNALTTENKYTLTYSTIFGKYSETGNWTLTDNDSKITFDPDGSADNYTWTILKLKEKEAWVKGTLNNKEVELHLIP